MVLSCHNGDLLGINKSILSIWEGRISVKSLPAIVPCRGRTHRGGLRGAYLGLIWIDL